MAPTNLKMQNVYTVLNTKAEIFIALGDPTSGKVILEHILKQADAPKDQYNTARLELANLSFKQGSTHWRITYALKGRWLAFSLKHEQVLAMKFGIQKKNENRNMTTEELMADHIEKKAIRLGVENKLARRTGSSGSDWDIPRFNNANSLIKMASHLSQHEAQLAQRSSPLGRQSLLGRCWQSLTPRFRPQDIPEYNIDDCRHPWFGRGSWTASGTWATEGTQAMESPRVALQGQLGGIRRNLTVDNIRRLEDEEVDEHV